MNTILLDIDGTLVDSNDAHASAWMAALREAEVDADPEVIRRSIGMGGDHVLPKILKIEADSAQGKQISKRRGEIFRAEHLKNLRALPGAVDLLKELKRRGKQLVVATSASAKDSKLILEQCGLSDHVDLVTNSDDADSSKPDPDIILAALEKAGVAANDAVMLGDTPYDIEAASRASVKTLAFTSGGWSRAELGTALRVYSGPDDLLAHLHDSPIS